MSAFVFLTTTMTRYSTLDWILSWPPRLSQLCLHHDRDSTSDFSPIEKSYSYHVQDDVALPDKPPLGTATTTPLHIGLPVRCMSSFTTMSWARFHHWDHDHDSTPDWILSRPPIVCFHYQDGDSTSDFRHSYYTRRCSRINNYGDWKHDSTPCWCLSEMYFAIHYDITSICFITTVTPLVTLTSDSGISDNYYVQDDVAG